MGLGEMGGHRSDTIVIHVHYLAL